MDTVIQTRQNGLRGPSAQEARGYDRIARAIEYLRHHAAGQPDLAAAARHASLSEYHFQRLFTRWAGVSPKRFLQYLTIEAAKVRLVRFASVNDVADDLGLSGAGRLHDLFATIEAVSPGEFRNAGAGLEIHYGVHDSPFGDCLIGMTARGICCVHFLDRGEEAAALLQRDWLSARLAKDTAGTATVAARLFDPLRDGSARAPLSLLVKGTNFQLQVWRALLHIPAGRVTTYGELGRYIGHAGSSRAVGNAVAANPVAWLIPCHRVIRETGEFGKYRWGEARKAAMLGWEAARCEVSGSVER